MSSASEYIHSNLQSQKQNNMGGNGHPNKSPPTGPIQEDPYEKFGRDTLIVPSDNEIMTPKGSEEIGPDEFIIDGDETHNVVTPRGTMGTESSVDVHEPERTIDGSEKVELDDDEFIIEGV